MKHAAEPFTKSEPQSLDNLCSSGCNAKPHIQVSNRKIGLADLWVREVPTSKKTLKINFTIFFRCDAVQPCRQVPTFRRSIHPPSSGLTRRWRQLSLGSFGKNYVGVICIFRCHRDVTHLFIPNFTNDLPASHPRRQSKLTCNWTTSSIKCEETVSFSMKFPFKFLRHPNDHLSVIQALKR